MTDAVAQAKVVHAVAFELIPVAASVALITVGIVQTNLTFISVGAGIMGLPGIRKVVQAITAD